MRVRIWLLRLTLAVAGLVAVAAPGPVFGVMCGDQPPLAQVIAKADTAFVGVVESVTNDDRWARVLVEDIWRGTVVTTSVEVRGGQEPGVGSSADRTYVAGERYLFMVEAAGGHFVDHLCTSTQPWDEDLTRFRPTDAVLASEVSAASVSRDPDPGSIILPGLAVVAIGVAVFGLVIALRPNR